MLTRAESKEIINYVLKEIRKTTYPYTTDGKLDARKATVGRAKGGTLGMIGGEYQHYMSDITWTSEDWETISWSSGTVVFADGRTQDITGDTLVLTGAGLNYFWCKIGLDTMQTSVNYYDGVGDDKAILAFATKAPENDQMALIIPFYGTEPTFNSNVLSANMIVAAHIKAGTITAQKLNFTAFDVGTDTLDTIIDGTTYKKVNSISVDGATGKITLSGTLQDASNRLTTDAEKSTWNGKPDNMDEIAIGITWSKPLKDQITVAGYLNLNANTFKSNQWYKETGVIIDSRYGIQLWGTNMAFATFGSEADAIARTNPKCYMTSTGQIVAGGGNVALDENGITIYCVDNNVYNRLKFTSGSFTGYIRGQVISGATGYLVTNCALWVPSLLPSTETATLGVAGSVFASANINTITSSILTTGYGTVSTRLKIPVGTDMYS